MAAVLSANIEGRFDESNRWYGGELKCEDEFERWNLKTGSREFLAHFFQSFLENPVLFNLEEDLETHRGY